MTSGLVSKTHTNWKQGCNHDLTLLLAPIREAHKQVVNFGFIFVIYAFTSARYIYKNGHLPWPVISISKKVVEDVITLTKKKRIKKITKASLISQGSQLFIQGVNSKCTTTQFIHDRITL